MQDFTKPMFSIFQRIYHFFEQRRSLSAVLLALAVILGGDWVFGFVEQPYLELLAKLTDGALDGEKVLDLGSAPEAWMGLMALVLGTLIIVISIASQSIPKLIDLYMEDFLSLFYVWMLVFSTLHALAVIGLNDMGWGRSSSHVFNLHLLFTAQALFAVPYILYILKLTKPHEVIDAIYFRTLRLIRMLKAPGAPALMKDETFVSKMQFELFEALNQLADLLEYVSFKEPKAEIIQRMSLLVREYVPEKRDIPVEFFEPTRRIRTDISFKTMVDQFETMGRQRTFLEQKACRLLGNAYIRLMEVGDFELSSLCVAELAAISESALEEGDTELIELLILRFNTTLRFAIKHGLVNDEARNLYNAAFHYGKFLENLLERDQVKILQKAFFYIRMYGTEIFKHGRKHPPLYFIVDVFAAEMKKILIRTHEKGTPEEVQQQLLREFLQIDSPPDFTRDDLDKGQLINNGVRVLQMALGLFYLREGRDGFVMQIIKDILDDVEPLGEVLFRDVIEKTCKRLQFSGPTFWEDTDRGNGNIYYTADQAQIEPFKQLVFAQLEARKKG
jgi:hypothetical protein